MGAEQSKPHYTPTAYEKEVIHHRLRSMRLDRSDEEDDFVHVGDEKVGLERNLEREPEGLAVEAVKDWETKLLADSKNRLALNALSGNNPKQVLTSRAAKIANTHVFNVQIPFEGAPITNQRSSGRCWLFASTNVFRVALMQKYRLEAFELSQAYLFFWDKLEKANWFLESVIDTADEDLEGRLVQRILADPVSDGGQWDMVYNLVDKYGLVPQALYPDSWSAMSSGAVNYVVVGKLREYALTLRTLLRSRATTAASLRGVKDRMMREIHAVLTLTLGPPPDVEESFTWDFVDKDGAARTVRKTPREFARDIAVSPRGHVRGSSSSSSSSSYTITNEAIRGMVSLVHDPRHAPLTLMTVDRLGNVVGGRGVTYINVDMGTLKQACVAMLRAGLPVFFGSDVGKFSDAGAGVMDLDLVDYGLGFNVDMYARLDKAARLRVGESAMTHAMVLTAVHVDEERDGETVRWRVQNSWGEAAGEKGWFVMGDRWMDEFVYQAVVDPRFLRKEVREVLKKEATVLPLWDPMGALA
ncbi:peptidase C1-like family protein [Xylariaceae sp. FL0016]|nr:peptidase C1-like family protein [Xylariaceae sp. FL0016]